MKIFITCLLLFIATFFSKVVNATIINDIKIALDTSKFCAKILH